MGTSKVGFGPYLLMLVTPLLVAAYYILTPNDVAPLSLADDTVVTLGMIGSSLWVNRNFNY